MSILKEWKFYLTFLPTHQTETNPLHYIMEKCNTCDLAIKIPVGVTKIPDHLIASLSNHFSKVLFSTFLLTCGNTFTVWWAINSDISTDIQVIFIGICTIRDLYHPTVLITWYWIVNGMLYKSTLVTNPLVEKEFTWIKSIDLQCQIGWIFKSKANESYCLYNNGPMVWHYALLYGFHTLPNMLKNLLVRHVRGFVMYTNA